MLFEKPLLKIICAVMSKKFDLKNAKEIPADGVIEECNIPYTNRVGKTLYMDIFGPRTCRPRWSGR